MYLNMKNVKANGIRFQIVTRYMYYTAVDIPKPLATYKYTLTAQKYS